MNFNDRQEKAYQPYPLSGFSRLKNIGFFIQLILPNGVIKTI